SHCLPQRWIFLKQAEQRALDEVVAILLADSLDYRAGIDPLVHVQRDRRHLERCTLSLPCPLEGRVEMRVVRITLPSSIPICVGRYKPDRRIVDPLLLSVRIVLDLPLRFTGLLRHSSLSHGASTVAAAYITWHRHSSSRSSNSRP